MAYVYKEVRSSDEVHDDEIVCVIYLDPHHNGNFTAVATDERLVEAFKDREAGKCRFVVWRDEDNPDYYQAYNEYGAIVDKGIEPKKPDVLQFSVDVEETDPTMMREKIEDALTTAGLNVLGVEWAARWTNEEYYKGRKPVSSL